MKNSVLLIDTNILLNYLTNRADPYLEQSVEIVRKCATGYCNLRKKDRNQKYH